MFKALVVKELRESLPLLAIAGLAVVYALMQHTGWKFFGNATVDWNQLGFDRSIPFALDAFEKSVILVAGGFAALLGLKQSAWEDFRGSYRYLLHRPAPRGTFLRAKLAVGVGLTLLIASGLTFAYTVWAATPGKHGSPFYLSMTIYSWQAACTLPIIYLSAFLSGIRPARWFGTRLAPLVTGFLFATVLRSQPWWQLTILGTAISIAIFIVCIKRTIATRDF